MKQIKRRQEAIVRTDGKNANSRRKNGKSKDSGEVPVIETCRIKRQATYRKGETQKLGARPNL
jgi:hypothetical protein